jgi:hypothetical protein
MREQLRDIIHFNGDEKCRWEGDDLVVVPSVNKEESQDLALSRCRKVAMSAALQACLKKIDTPTAKQILAG